MSGKGVEAIVIGASAGAIEALGVVLSDLPASYPLPIMIVVHIPPDRRSVMAELFAARFRMSVCEAEDKQPIEGRMIYFAPPDYHLLVEQDRVLSLSRDEAVLYSRPSIDVLFESAADAYGKGLVGIVLTGANSDGAKGLKAIASEGGTVVVQEPSEAYATAMPLAAIQACPKAHVLRLQGISNFLMEVGLR